MEKGAGAEVKRENGKKRRKKRKVDWNRRLKTEDKRQGRKGKGTDRRRETGKGKWTWKRKTEITDKKSLGIRVKGGISTDEWHTLYAWGLVVVCVTWLEVVILASEAWAITQFQESENSAWILNKWVLETPAISLGRRPHAPVQEPREVNIHVTSQGICVLVRCTTNPTTTNDITNLRVKLPKYIIQDVDSLQMKGER